MLLKENMHRLQVGMRVRCDGGGSAKFYTGIIRYIDLNDIGIERDDGVHGAGKNRVWSVSLHEPNVTLGILEETLTKSTTFMSSLVQKFADLFIKEPQKSFRKSGVTDTNDQLTSDGKELLMNWLLAKHKDEFLKDVITPILEAEEAKKEKE